MYGLSDVGLAKICKKLRIARPERGYWRRRECGYKVSRPPLPVLKSPVSLITQIATTASVKSAPIPEEFTSPLILPRADTAINLVTKQTRIAYTKGASDQFGRVRVSDWRLPHFDCRVTQSGLQRALQFVDSLAKLIGMVPWVETNG